MHPTSLGDAGSCRQRISQLSHHPAPGMPQSETHHFAAATGLLRKRPMKHWRQVGNHLAMEGFPITIWTPGIHSSTSKCRERPKLLTPSMDALGRTYHLQRCVLSPKLHKLSQIFLTGLSHWTDRVTQEQVKGCKEEEYKQMQKEGFFPRRLRVSQQTNDPPKKKRKRRKRLCRFKHT